MSDAFNNAVQAMLQLSIDERIDVMRAAGRIEASQGLTKIQTYDDAVVEQRIQARRGERIKGIVADFFAEDDTGNVILFPKGGAS